MLQIFALERIHGFHDLVLQQGARQVGEVQIEEEFPFILTWSKKLRLPSRNTCIDLRPQFRDILLHLEE